MKSEIESQLEIALTKGTDVYTHPKFTIVQMTSLIEHLQSKRKYGKAPDLVRKNTIDNSESGLLEDEKRIVEQLDIIGSLSAEDPTLKEDKSMDYYRKLKECYQNIFSNFLDNPSWKEAQTLKHHYIFWLAVRDKTLDIGDAIGVLFQGDRTLANLSKAYNYLVKEAYIDVQLKDSLIKLLKQTKKYKASTGSDNMLSSSREPRMLADLADRLERSDFLSPGSFWIIRLLTESKFFDPITDAFQRFLRKKDISVRNLTLHTINQTGTLEKLVKDIHLDSYNGDAATREFVKDLVKINNDYFAGSVRFAAEYPSMIPADMKRTARKNLQRILERLYEERDLVRFGKDRYFIAVYEVPKKPTSETKLSLMKLEKDANDTVQLLQIEEEIFEKLYFKYKEISIENIVEEVCNLILMPTGHSGDITEIPPDNTIVLIQSEKDIRAFWNDNGKISASIVLKDLIPEDRAKLKFPSGEHTPDVIKYVDDIQLTSTITSLSGYKSNYYLTAEAQSHLKKGASKEKIFLKMNYNSKDEKISLEEINDDELKKYIGILGVISNVKKFIYPSWYYPNYRRIIPNYVLAQFSLCLNNYTMSSDVIPIYKDAYLTKIINAASPSFFSKLFHLDDGQEPINEKKFTYLADTLMGFLRAIMASPMVKISSLWPHKLPDYYPTNKEEQLIKMGINTKASTGMTFLTEWCVLENIAGKEHVLRNFVYSLMAFLPNQLPGNKRRVKPSKPDKIVKKCVNENPNLHYDLLKVIKPIDVSQADFMRCALGNILIKRAVYKELIENLPLKGMIRDLDGSSLNSVLMTPMEIYNYKTESKFEDLSVVKLAIRYEDKLFFEALAEIHKSFLDEHSSEIGNLLKQVKPSPGFSDWMQNKSYNKRNQSVFSLFWKKPKPTVEGSSEVGLSKSISSDELDPSPRFGTMRKKGKPKDKHVSEQMSAVAKASSL